MGVSKVEWTLQLKEIYELSKQMNVFSLEDLIKRSDQSEKEIRRNISILLSFDLLKLVKHKKNIYKFGCD